MNVETAGAYGKIPNPFGDNPPEWLAIVLMGAFFLLLGIAMAL